MPSIQTRRYSRLPDQMKRSRESAPSYPPINLTPAVCTMHRSPSVRACRSMSVCDQPLPARALHRQGGQGSTPLFLSVVMGVALWIDGGVVAGSSFEAPDVTIRDTIAFGMATGVSQGPIVIGHAQSSNRNTIFVPPRAGTVPTDRAGTDLKQRKVELLLKPLIVRGTQPFTPDPGGGYLVVRYNFRSSKGESHGKAESEPQKQ